MERGSLCTPVNDDAALALVLPFFLNNPGDYLSISSNSSPSSLLAIENSLPSCVDARKKENLINVTDNNSMFLKK